MLIPRDDSDPIAEGASAPTRTAALGARFAADLRRRVPDTSAMVRRGSLACVLGIIVIAVGVLLAMNVRRLYGYPLLAPGVWLILRGMDRLRRAAALRRSRHTALRVARTGRPAVGTVVCADDALYRPGTIPQPCRILVSFDGEVASDTAWMVHLARRWASRRSPDDRMRIGRRERLPESLTDGYTVWAIDLLVHPLYLPSGYMSGPTLTCLIEPETDGAVEHVPYWLLFPFAQEDVGNVRR